jgi:hypothetical protein
MYNDGIKTYNDTSEFKVRLRGRWHRHSLPRARRWGHWETQLPDGTIWVIN